MVVEKSFFEPAERDRAEMLLSLVESAGILNSKLSLSELGDTIISESRRVFDAKAAWVLLYDPEDDLLKMHCYWGPDEEAFRDTVIQPGMGISGKVFITQHPKVVVMVDKQLVPQSRRRVPGTQALTVVTYPLTVDQKKIGVFSMSFEKTASTENLEGSINPTFTFAQQVAIAIENARLYSAQIETGKKVETYAEQLRLLNELSRIITREKEPQAMADQLAAGARVLLGCSAAAVLLHRKAGDDGLMISWSTDSGESCKMLDTSPDFTSHSGLCSAVSRTKEAIRLDDIFSHPQSKGIPEKHIAIRDLLGVPLLDSEGNFMGQVMVTDKKDGSNFSKTDEELLIALCAQVAIGIEKAKAYEREHSIAEVLQQAILDVPRNLPGVEVGIAYESAGEAAKVGGDFYDLFELGDGRRGLLIGDVSGKGLEAATITSMVKSTVRAFAYKGLSPARVIVEANRVIYRQLRFDQF
ncbi:MAG TPA: GAF domain-containing protein, partial [Anaerolineae bacterium]|nr:GAF domain-containing protein [Anaerolineae bacterium]